MKKLFQCLFVTLLTISIFSVNVFAATIYLPTNTSSEYLPTVKILTYSLGSDGNLFVEGYGSGTLIDSAGVVLTNNHVIENYYDPTTTYDAFEICLTKSNAPQDPICEFTGSFIARDPAKDIALIKMDSLDVRGKKLDFDFYLPYDKSENYTVGQDVTVIGYPDTGGRTITYTSGLISGLVKENGINYIKTDADISFGNSGGTAVSESGDFIGIPTYIVGSESSEVLGYLFPLKDALSFITKNKSGDVITDEVAKGKLKSSILAYINANENGHYENDYPPYEISTISGWEFGNSMEAAFEQGSYYTTTSSEALTIAPVEISETSALSITVSAEKFPYEVSISDLRKLMEDYFLDYYGESSEASYTIEEVKFNNKYSALKTTDYFYDWYYGTNVNTVGYGIPYGDYVISIEYSYTDEESSRVSEVDQVLATFEIDMKKIKSSVVSKVSSDDPVIKVTNPLADGYLSDGSYEYDGVNYFGATFGKKTDYDFSVGIYYDLYWDESYVGNFELFKSDTLSSADDWESVIAKGELELDGHNGFFYIGEYDDGYDDPIYTAYLYVAYDDQSYVNINYSGTKESYQNNLLDFNKILNVVTLDNEGQGRYFLPSFDISVSMLLSDIENYVYEENIRNLDKKDIFGTERPAQFNPAGKLTRKDFVVWAVKNGDETLLAEFEDFKNGIIVGEFSDVDYATEESKYVEFARSKGAVSGNKKGSKLYFKPDEQISLVAGLKIVFTLYGYDVWEAPSFIPWYIPYIQLAYKNYLMPYGVNDVNYLLTRGEGVYIIDSAMAANYYYDDVWY